MLFDSSFIYLFLSFNRVIFLNVFCIAQPSSSAIESLFIVLQVLVCFVLLSSLNEDTGERIFIYFFQFVVSLVRPRIFRRLLCFKVLFLFRNVVNSHMICSSTSFRVAVRYFDMYRAISTFFPCEFRLTFICVCSYVSRANFA